MTGFAQDDTGVDVERSEGDRSCGRSISSAATEDAASSAKRPASSSRWDPTRSNLIAEVEATEETRRGIRHDATGVHGFAYVR